MSEDSIFRSRKAFLELDRVSDLLTWMGKGCAETPAELEVEGADQLCDVLFIVDALTNEASRLDQDGRGALAAIYREIAQRHQLRAEAAVEEYASGLRGVKLQDFSTGRASKALPAESRIEDERGEAA
jgi:hypothetical protein